MVTNWPLCIVHTVQTVFLLDLSYEGQVTPKMGSAQEKAAVRFVQTRTEFLEESVGDGLGLWGGGVVYPVCFYLLPPYGQAQQNTHSNRSVHFDITEYILSEQPFNCPRPTGQKPWVRQHAAVLLPVTGMAFLRIWGLFSLAFIWFSIFFILEIYLFIHLFNDLFITFIYLSIFYFILASLS